MDHRLQVLLLTNMPAPYRLPVFEALAEHVDLTVYFCRAKDLDRLWQTDVRSKHVHYEVLSERMIRGPRGVEFIFNPGLWRRLRDIPFDVYIAGENLTTFPAVLNTLRAARRWKRPFILWSEAIDTPYASGNLLSNAYRRWLYSQTHAFVAYGQRAKAYLERRGAPHERITIGFQVVPSAQLPAPAADKAALGLAGKTVVLYVGYFVARKGLRHLIKAFQAVAKENDVLALAGSGPEEPHLHAMARGDQRIIFPGYCEGSEKTSWYAAADLFVLPTLHDPWGLVVNEAMAFGLPVVATDAAGCTDLVQDNGRIVPAGNSDKLASALEQLLRNESLLHRMGQSSRHIISSYTVEAACGAFLQAIGDACQNR